MESGKRNSEGVGMRREKREGGKDGEREGRREKWREGMW